MTPQDLEARLAGRPDGATVAALVEELRADPAWTLTEFTLAGQLVHVDLVYHPTGEAFTLRAQRNRSVQRAEGGT